MLEIENPAFDALCAYGIGGLALVMAVICSVFFSRGDKRRAALLLVVMAALAGLSAALALSGWLSRFDFFPPPMAMMIASFLLISIGAGVSSFGNACTELSYLSLIAFQSFRLPLELLMNRAGRLGIMLPELSFSGYNFDIVTGFGALAIALAFVAGKNVDRRILWAWNIWGLLCLVIILFIAVAGSPIFRFFGDDPRHLNTWVLFFPYVWLPIILVTLAIFGHVVLTRKLLKEPK